MSALATAAACMNAAMAVASGAATIVAAGRLGAAWGALPNAVGISGTGLGALLLTRVMARRGRKAGLLSGYAVATAGGALAVAAVTGAIGHGGGDAPDIAGLCAGMLLLGCGNAGAQLSRYAAAELYPAHRRGGEHGLDRDPVGWWLPHARDRGRIAHAVSRDVPAGLP